MAELRVSVVQYLNTAPLIWGLTKGKQGGKFQLDFTSPAGCADALRSGCAGDRWQATRSAEFRLAETLRLSVWDAYKPQS